MSEEERKQQKKRGGCLKWVVIIFGVLILLGACGALLGGGDSTDTTSTETNDSTTENSTSDEPAEEAETESVEEDESTDTVNIGEQIDVGDMSYTVNEVTTDTQVGPSAFPTTANETYVILDITVTNNGNEAITVDASYFKLLIEEATLNSDSTASMSANQNENGEIVNSFFLENLNPGSTLSGKIVFDISQSYAENTDKQLQVQSGMFGTETGIINLK